MARNPFVIMTNPDKSSISPKLPGDTRRRKTHGRATLADVARHAGVTTMTVSRTLREPQRVTAETAERVHAALKHTGYTPNKSAGLLASGRSRIVAALIPNISNALFAETIQGLSDALQGDNLELLLAATGYSPEREEHQIRAVLGWAPAALVVTGRHHTDGALAMMRRAQSEGTPVIEMWDHAPRQAEFIQVGFNHRQAGKAMLDHLAECGYRDLVYVDSGVAGDVRAHERRQGFLGAASRAKIQARLISAPQLDPMVAGRQVLQDLLDSGTLPRAIAFSNDNFAAGACLQAMERGIELPTRLGLMGFGDMPIASQLGGGISTLAVPRYRIGQCTGERLLSNIAAGAGLGETASSAGGASLLAPHLVVRQTTRLR